MSCSSLLRLQYWIPFKWHMVTSTTICQIIFHQVQHGDMHLNTYSPMLCPTISTNMGETWVDKQHYQSLVGALIYATITCIDILYCVRCVSCYYQNHKIIILSLPKLLFATWKAPSQMDFTFPTQLNWHSPHMLMQIMVISLMLMGPSLTFCIKLGDALFKWRSKRQPTIAMSTIEDEYKVLSNVACDYVYLQCFLHELKIGGGSSVKYSMTTIVAWSLLTTLFCMQELNTSKHDILSLEKCHKQVTFKFITRYQQIDILTKSTTSLS